MSVHYNRSEREKFAPISLLLLRIFLHFPPFWVVTGIAEKKKDFVQLPRLSEVELSKKKGPNLCGQIRGKDEKVSLFFLMRIFLSSSVSIIERGHTN